ncbi:tetratricopeptide repeat protein 36 [Microplitis demolitor]|uniref:tetratricopeptide repeat protein 36 n=1 Tax=Microplitis demolitor TaxID=69319 RepID=UPI0004CDBCA6|nr:tetratricopeptide repeat protein 36 [Microplitis demolitor]
MEQLSEHDKSVLDVIFDPLQLMSSGQNLNQPEDQVTDKINDQEIVELVKRAIETAECGELDKALNFFDKAIAKAPDCPSILNDRAQALRLAGRVDEALKDLDQAVTMSGGRGKAGTKALCQRGLLHRLEGREDDAKRDFQAAANNGSAFARNQLVNLNPYAAMCNAMLREMTSKSVNL